ncbi:uncharacterized protein LOC113209272 isoform X2 [Frankliniella occidentalis]|uniref:Uncharacterized protein LOC113209272 isoform X2 n=1 Tax=Frankliniella occidentalis TaxID=133901 RepID=A0A9C6XSP0_FRAOC|nr:uncharacterized protein LOC113209272 isoform X2 [Frankliniella occidentalis]
MLNSSGAGSAKVYVPAVLALVLLSGLQSARASLSSDRETFQHCKDKDHYLRITDVNIELAETGDELWTVGFNVLQPSKSFQRFRVNIEKCHLDRGACESWNSWSWDVSVCSLLFVNGTVWAPLVQNIVPRFSCPVKEGHYVAVNSTLDIDTLVKTVKHVPVLKHSWRIEVQLYNERKELHICFNVLAKLSRVVVRN